MTELKIPELAESIRTGTIATWLVAIGDPVEAGGPVLELETDKINIEIPAETNGVLTSIKKEVGEQVQVGDVVAIISNTTEGKEHTEIENRDKEKTHNTTIHTGKLKRAEDYIVASPATRKRARQLGINLKDISVSDPLGKIKMSDVESFKKREVSNYGKFAEPLEQQVSTDSADLEKPIERIKMSQRRQTIAKHLVEAQQQAAMLTTFNEVDLSVVMDIRREHKEAFIKKYGVKLGLMSFFTKAVVTALMDFPYLNAELLHDEILLKKFYDIGIAVSTDEGLVVPVVREVDKKGFAEIETEISHLSEKARSRNLDLNDMAGSTFTITNGGVFGSLFSTPILNTPEVGILGMHKIQKRPIVLEDDTIAVRPMMYIALSYDHRIIDGKQAVQFLARIKQLLEDPQDLISDYLD
ncbi:dihydrolipoyllysine-residue succinyltransferase component of 2-oxoglutarate dehydrogenase complex [Paraliobacillus quinghaiensis]|uniref:Dihydrolipoyllysine-residue succinyltransferase component of 2-oxoglutarate dehydrogenase complex n=1 Tax=Paraliobacillus quinghaiensis TaxID=470815 RepID=A0A917TJW9_9BACI|nr:2-oxoglutarate dehydrogenase complex dihydrolipoyllysine-residue succinyltransferase [Paraliobacillus quinghaiensis]GGM25995.1 dihydrolipoyllysine-residue succinyltransferase component of 2-oxoglutarate dehydrogenase complex [Paraliobacillus quinghaiensis]